MTNSGLIPAHGRQPSEVLDAIFDAVAELSPDELAKEPRVFRDKALAQVDIPRQVDKLLPITTPRLWIALVGAAVLLLAGGVYAASTTAVESVTVMGRVVAVSGVVSVDSVVAMSVAKLVIAEGMEVRQGELLATGTTATGQPAELRSPSEGTVWQILASPGQTVAQGEALVTILPAGSRGTVLVPVEEGVADGVLVGQKVRISDAGIDSPGLVTNVSRTPLSGVRAAELTALSLDPLATYVLVSVTAADSLANGAEVEVEIVESESTVLGAIVSAH